MTVENAMMQAIKMFKRLKVGEINSIAVDYGESRWAGKKYDVARFNVEYCPAVFPGRHNVTIKVTEYYDFYELLADNGYEIEVKEIVDKRR